MTRRWWKRSTSHTERDAPSTPGAEDAKLASKIEKVDGEYAEWLAVNPHGSRSEFYVARVVDRLSAGQSHATLGKKRYDPGTGQRRASRLISWGIDPEHVVVDYGCGSLRVGRHLIEYLEPGCYWGLDLTRDFIDIGLKTLDAALVTEKRPHLETITAESLERAATAGPDFIFCNAVVLHVAPEELEEFFANLLSVVGTHTTAWIKVHLMDELTRTGPSSWAHSIEHLASLVEAQGASIVDRRDKPLKRKTETIAFTPSWLTVRRRAARDETSEPAPARSRR